MCKATYYTRSIMSTIVIFAKMYEIAATLSITLFLDINQRFFGKLWKQRAATGGAKALSISYLQ